MELRHQLFYGIILRSAKSRFDHGAFQDRFGFNADPILIQLIEAYSAARSDNQIVNEMHDAAYAFGHNWRKSDIHEFILDKCFIFRPEIATTSLMTDMINMGFSQSHIFDIVSQLCGNRKPLYILR